MRSSDGISEICIDRQTRRAARMLSNHGRGAALTKVGLTVSKATIALCPRTAALDKGRLPDWSPILEAVPCESATAMSLF